MREGCNFNIYAGVTFCRRREYVITLESGQFYVEISHSVAVATEVTIAVVFAVAASRHHRRCRSRCSV